MVDSLDKRLIELLEQDATVSSQVLANQLSLNSSTVRRRMQKLLRQGVIRIFARPEPSKIGLPLIALIAFDVDHEHLSSVIEMLNSRPEVKWLAATSGRFDLIAMVYSASTDELYTFIEKEIGKTEGIKNTETFICLYVRKSM